MIKCNCYKLDIKILQDGISKYKADNLPDPSFIVMNDITLSEFIHQKDELFQRTVFEKWEGGHAPNDTKYYSYWGIPIAICNKLENGEVKIV